LSNVVEGIKRPSLFLWLKGIRPKRHYTLRFDLIQLILDLGHLEEGKRHRGTNNIFALEISFMKVWILGQKMLYKLGFEPHSSLLSTYFFKCCILDSIIPKNTMELLYNSPCGENILRISILSPKDIWLMLLTQTIANKCYLLFLF